MRAQGSPGNASALTESMCMNSPQSESLELYLLKYFCGFCAVPYEIKKVNLHRNPKITRRRGITRVAKRSRTI